MIRSLVAYVSYERPRSLSASFPQETSFSSSFFSSYPTTLYAKVIINDASFDSIAHDINADTSDKLGVLGKTRRLQR